MIPAIQNPVFAQRQEPVRAQFNEGAASTANKVVAFVGALVASIASFFLLPFEGALLASVGLGTIASLFACQSSEAAPVVAGQAPPRAWWDTALRVIPFFRRDAQPVRQPGYRVAVGAGHQRPPVVLQQPVVVQPQLPVARQRHPGAVRLAGIGQQPPLRPVLNQHPAIPPVQQQLPGGIHGQQRVHVGHGHQP